MSPNSIRKSTWQHMGLHLQRKERVLILLNLELKQELKLELKDPKKGDHFLLLFA